MILYDNDAYREEFMGIVYGILSSDITNDRANQIIDAFGSAPQVEIDERSSTDPLTLEELREMDGEPVWNDTMEQWVIVDTQNSKTVNVFGRWRPLSDRYYRRKPEGRTR